MKEILITSSVLIVVLLILRAIFANKVRRTLIYGTWILVALRLLIPIQIGHLPFSVLSFFQPATETVTEVLNKPVAGKTEQDAYRQVLQEHIQDYIENAQKDQTVFTPEVQDHIQSALDQELPKEEIVGSIEKDYVQQEVYVPEVQPQVQQEVEEATNAITLGQIATAVWLVGMVVVAVWLAVGNLTIVRSLKRSAKAIAWDSPIPVYVSEKAISPCLVGLFRPRVYLTPESAGDESILRHVMTHELTHYAHRDHIWSAVRCLCLCLYWFDPLVWVAAFCSRRDCELACDEGALRRLGEEQRIAYGKALLQVVRNTTVPGKLMLTATTMAETKKQLLRRVSFIAKKPRWSMIAAVSMVLVCALVAGCVAAGPEAAPAAEDPDLSNTEAVLAPTATDPTGAVPAATEPTVTNPTVTGPTASDPTVTDPTVIAPTVTNPIVTEPVVTNPSVTEPAVTTPTEPTATQPQDVHNKLVYQVNEDGTTCTVTGTRNYTNQTLVIPETIDGYRVTAIGTQAFILDDFTGVVLPDSLISIGIEDFSRCDKLTSVTFGKQLTTIGTQAFNSCTSLESLVLPESVTEIGGAAFYGCSKLTSVTIPESVTIISGSAFSGCSKLTAIRIPEGVTAIGGSAFSGCSSLTEINIPKNITVIADSLFFGCTNLKSILIPEGVTSIGMGAFRNCIRLEQVVIPDAVETIDLYAFQNCLSLTSLTIGKGVNQIGSDAFYSCNILAQISVSPENTAYHSAGNCLIETKTKTLIQAGKDCVIPSDGSVTTIGRNAFRQQHHLRQIVVPEGIQSIERDAFTGCSELAEVHLPQSLQSMYNSFENCGNLKHIYYNGTLQQWDTIRYISDTNFNISAYSIMLHCTDKTYYRGNILTP